MNKLEQFNQMTEELMKAAYDLTHGNYGIKRVDISMECGNDEECERYRKRVDIDYELPSVKVGF